MLEELLVWIDVTISSLEYPASERQAGYREALEQVKEFIDQELDLMNHE
jgi:hypothetical protein